jgi:hypothetical protein
MHLHLYIINFYIERKKVAKLNSDNSQTLIAHHVEIEKLLNTTETY